ncbi:MAG: bifunctional DNA-formamidopyrimidine glycosylase/DNA-(apurinic or apyrimidinic site) lyase [Acidobacteriota bacterium]
MPELPEVETIRRGLVEHVKGLTIRDVVWRECRIFQLPAERLGRELRAQSIREITRRGKFLIFELDRHYCIVHLGMTGQLTVRDPARADSKRFYRHPNTGLQRIRQHAPDPHTHLQICFENGKALLFRDIRKFGRVHLLEKGSEVLSIFFRKLGLEPFSEQYVLAAFLKQFAKRKVRTKSLLLDQSFVAGIGNIYADEALFWAGIHPSRRVTTLRRYEKERLFHVIHAVLRRGIRFGGTTLRDYINSEGESGSHQEELMVYGRAGKSCRSCGSRIEKIVISQRGTCFCPLCQPRSRPRRDLQVGLWAQS